MGLIADIKTIIAGLLPDNNNQSISAEDARQSFDAVLDNLSEIGSNYYGTVITTSAAISGVEENATVLPLEDGTYANFDGLTRDNELCIFVYIGGAWSKKIVKTINQSRFTPNFNLLDIDSKIIGFILDHTTGELNSNASYSASIFIEIQESTDYYVSASQVSFYNGSHTYISGTSGVERGITSPSNAKFIRLSWLNTEPTPYLIQYDSAATVPSEYTFSSERLKVNTNNIGDDFITSVENADYFVFSKNLFNKDDITEGFFVNGDTGVEQANASLSHSGFIKVDESENYVYSGIGRRVFHAWYDKNKQYISGSNSAYPTLSPAGAAFVRVSFNIGTEDNLMFEQGIVATNYEPYSVDLDSKYKKVTEAETSFYERTKNLFNKENISEGFFVSWVDGSLQSNPTYDASEFIPVTESLEYFLSGEISKFAAWYDSDKVFISGNQTGDYPLTAPVGAEYARVTILSGEGDSAQYEQASDFTYYEPYYRLITKRENNGYIGLLWSTMGDSVTALASWQKYVFRELGLRYPINNGIGGTRISGTGSNAMWQDVRINALDINSDIISVMGGTNDWFQNAVIGTIDSSDTNEFYGALNVMIEKLTTRFPDKKIILQTPPYSLIGTTQNEAATKNTLSLTVIDYAECIKQIGKKWGLPVVDTASGCGWNYINIDTYVIDDGNYLHPNDLGGRRLASKFIGELKSINPIS